MGEAKLVFLSFETKYLTPTIRQHIKLKLLKSYIQYKKLTTLCLKNTKTTAILQNIANFPSKFKLFVFCLSFTYSLKIFRPNTTFFKSFHLTYGPNLTLSISTQNSEKLNQIGFHPPLTYHSSLLIVQWLKYGGARTWEMRNHKRDIPPT